MTQNTPPQGLEPIQNLEVSGFGSRPRPVTHRLRLTIRGRSITLRGLQAQPTGILRLFFILGPGLVAASAGNDAGGIATYSLAGAQFGYELIWVMVLITVSLGVVQETVSRLGAASGRGLLDLIRERYGAGWGVFAVGVILIANFGLVVSEFVGIGAAAGLLGVSKFIAVPVSAALLWYLIIYGSYRRVERVFLLMTLVFFGYPIAAVLAKPDWGELARGAFVPTIRFDALYMVSLVGLLGTTITPYMQLFQQSSIVERGVARRHYGPEKLDAFFGSIFSNLMSISMIVATAATLHAAGQTNLEDVADAARALEPVAGSGARILFAIGLLGASMLAGAVLPLATAYGVSEVFGLPKGVSLDFRRAPSFFGLFTAMIVLGALVALIPGLPVIDWLHYVQVLNGVLLPIMLVFILRLANDAQLMGPLKNTRLYNLLGWGTFGMVTTAVAILLGGQLFGLF